MAFEVIDQSLLLASVSELPLIIVIGDHVPFATAPEGGNILAFAASDEIEISDDFVIEASQSTQSSGEFGFVDGLVSQDNEANDDYGTTVYVDGGDDPRTVGSGTGNSGSGTGPSGGGGASTANIYELCQDTSQMAAEQREDYQVAVEAAEIAQEIQAKADRDSVEYGAIIYRDSNGIITHALVTRGNATSVPNMSTAGIPGWGNVLGYVHSHPGVLFNSAYPEMRLHPTPHGDWDAFNAIQNLMVQDLVGNRGYSVSAAWAKANGLVQFIYGASGISSSGNYSYGLYRYDDGDEMRETAPDAEQVDNAEHVSTRLGTCAG